MTLKAGRDATGRAVLAGDVVVWSRSGGGGALVFGVVESFTEAGRVRISVLWSPTGIAAPGETHTADRDRVVLVERGDDPQARLERTWRAVRDAHAPNGT